MATKDMQWLEDLYNEYYDRLYKLACLKLIDSGASTEDAHDIVQDVFLLAIKKNIRKHPNPPAWLYKTATNYCMNYIRAHQRNYKKILKLESSQETFQSPEISDEDVMAVLESKLSAQDFWLMKSYCIDKIPLATISSKTGLSENAIYIRICRIRKQMKSLFLILFFLLSFQQYKF